MLITRCQVGLAGVYSPPVRFTQIADEKEVRMLEMDKKRLVHHVQGTKENKKENLTCCMFDLRRMLSTSGMWHDSVKGFNIIPFYASSSNASKGRFQ